MTTDPDASPTPPAPRGVVARLRTLSALALEGLLLLALLLWLAGRVVSDRFLWTQYPGWAPTELVLPAAALLLAAASLVRWRRPRAIPGLAVLLLAAWMFLGEWRVHRAVLPGPARGDLRVSFMNISHLGEGAALGPFFGVDADIAVMSNVHPQPVSFERLYGVTHQSLMERTIGLIPGEAPPGEAHMARVGYYHVFSEHPIRRRATAFLGVQETWLEGDTRGGGSVLMLEIDAPGGPLIVWAIDMPSTLGASRRAMFEQMRTTVDAVARVSVIDPVGRWVSEELGERDPLRTPDLIVGDFNTPSHAWSIDRFSPRTRDVRADAGWGPPGTFPTDSRRLAPLPRGVPLFPIDTARLGGRVRATHLETIRCDGCRHLGFVLDLRRRD